MKNYIDNKIENFCINFIKNKIAKGYNAEQYLDDIIIEGVYKFCQNTKYRFISNTSERNKVIKKTLKLVYDYHLEKKVKTITNPYIDLETLIKTRKYITENIGYYWN